MTTKRRQAAAATRKPPATRDAASEARTDLERIDAARAMNERRACLFEAAGAGRRAASHLHELIGQVDARPGIFPHDASFDLRNLRECMDMLVAEIDEETERRAGEFRRHGAGPHDGSRRGKDEPAGAKTAARTLPRRSVRRGDPAGGACPGNRPTA